MFSNLASYLLGYGETTTTTASDAPTTPEGEQMRLSTVETEEDDWLMVHTTRRESIASRGGAGSRSSSTSSLPTCLSMEESWFVTPPPCFTSTGVVTVETSPLENLLIEHPSMSVYDRTGLTIVAGNRMIVQQSNQQQQQSQQPPRARSLSPRPQQTGLPQTRHHRAPLQPNYYHNLQLQMYTAQKQQITKDGQILKSKQLERSNKVRDVNKRNKRQRRSDRQKNHSGANNNRKCC